ncbi:MAG: hypothetical protein Q9184_000733 [Pyrenodesmia sp. 2 TL-2023]
MPSTALSQEGQRRLRELYHHFKQDRPEVGEQSRSPIAIAAKNSFARKIPHRKRRTALTLSDDDNDPTPTSVKRRGVADNVRVTDNGSYSTPVGVEQRAITISSEEDALQVVPVRKKSVGRPRTVNLEGPPALGPSYNDPWGAILIQSNFELPKSIESYLEASTSYDATHFLQDAQLPSLSGVGKEDKIPDFCRKVVALPQRGGKEHLYRLFLLLTVGDMAAKLGGTWQRRIKAMPDNADFNEIGDTLKMGMSLVQLSDTFGTGSIFWFEESLTDNVYVSYSCPFARPASNALHLGMANNMIYRCCPSQSPRMLTRRRFSLLRKLSWSGKWFNKARDHLKKPRAKRMSVLEAIKESRSNELGDAIRAHLSVLYQVDQTRSADMDNHHSDEQRTDGDEGASDINDGLRVHDDGES